MNKLPELDGVEELRNCVAWADREHEGSHYNKTAEEILFRFRLTKEKIFQEANPLQFTGVFDDILKRINEAREEPIRIPEEEIHKAVWELSEAHNECH